jgi:hypothetical protein
MTKELNQTLVAVYHGRKCQCGRPKAEKQPFCFTCWNALEDFPGRNKLTHLFGEEYAVLYFRCCDFLNGKAVKK